MVAATSLGTTFWLYAVVCAAVVVLGALAMPETRGRPSVRPSPQGDASPEPRHTVV